MIRTAKEHLSGTETTDRAVRVDQTARKIARSAECVRVRNHSSTCLQSPALRSSTHGDAWLHVQLQMCAESERSLGGVKDKSWVVCEPAGS